jgi:hypothetical protein
MAVVWRMVRGNSLDNDAPPKHPQVKARLAKRARYRVHFTPMYSTD